MSPLTSRRAVSDLDRALDPASTGPTDVGPGTASLVAVVEQLRRTGAELEPVVAPRDEFRAALRSRLVAVATVRPVGEAVAEPAPAARAGLRARRGMGVAAGALASVVAVSGVAVASTQSLPGDPFYALKRAAEGLQVRAAGGAVDEGDRHLQFAATRLDEVRALTLGRDVDVPPPGATASPDTDWRQVRETLSDMDAETVRGTTLLTRAWRDDGDARALQLLTEFSAEQTAGLQALLPLLPANVLGDAQSSLALATSVRASADELRTLAACTEACGPGAAVGEPCTCPTPPAAVPGDGADPSAPAAPGAPAPGPASTGPEAPGTPGSSPAPPAQPSAEPAPTLPVPVPTITVPVPTLPSELPSTLPTVSPSLLPSLSPTPLPDLDLGLDDLAP